MIKPLKQYISDEGLPRCSSIFLTPEAALAVVVVLGFFCCGGNAFSVFPKVSDLTTGLIAYASIALGFCVAGLTISLTLPDRKFACTLAKKRNSDDKTNPYSDLLFVFSWTAIAHWIAIIVLFVIILFVDNTSPILPIGHSLTRRWAVACIAGLCVYCLCQFLITLITLSQVGNLYITHLGKQDSDNGARPPGKNGSD